MIDGPLFSIYPFKNEQYTVTDVEHTPLFISPNIDEIRRFNYDITKEQIKSIRDKIENKITYYYNNFTTNFKYNRFYTSIKVKRYSASADRYPLITKEDNIITCNTGKIQGIYILEDYINEIISR